jgi:mRNA interferase MazF
LTEIRRGEVWWVSLDPTIGSETQKTRPCVIVQRDAANETSPTTVICPIAGAGRRKSGISNPLVRAPEGGLTKDGIVVCNQIRAIDRGRIGDRLGQLSPDAMLAIDRGLRAILDV